MAAHLAIPNQPQILNLGQPVGGNIAIETQITNELRNPNAPISEIHVTIIPGNVDDPYTLFHQGLADGYSRALAAQHRAPNPQHDSVIVVIHHDGIYANGGSWGTPNLVVSSALDEIVERWEAAMQSGEEIDLSIGALEMICTFTLTGPRRDNPDFPEPEVRMGARAVIHHQFKKRMFHRSVHDQMYTHSHALRKVPFTDGKWCFPMAFAFSQCRRWIFTEGKIADVIESKALQGPLTLPQLHAGPYFVFDLASLADHAGQYLDLKAQYQRWNRRNKTNVPVMRGPNAYSQQSLFGESLPIVLFNPFKTPMNYHGTRTEIKEYALEECSTPQQLEDWIWLAQQIHRFVEFTQQRQLDHTLFYECVQAYADTFRVHIHVFRHFSQTQEANCFYPHSPSDSFLDHVYVHFGDHEGNYEHCHSVTSRRDMVRRPHYGSHVSTGSAHYCDSCHESFYSRKSREDCLAHLQDCYLKKYVPSREATRQGQRISGSQPPDRERLTHPKPFQKMKGEEAKFYCTTCLEKEIGSDQRRTHRCHVTLPELPAIPSTPHELELYLQNPNNKYNRLYVYDIETQQIPLDDKKKVHQCNCVCFRRVGHDTPRIFFDTMDAFCEHLLESPEYVGATLFAHNGGNFDHQFFIQYLEKHCIPYRATPRPGSVHKYIQIEIDRIDCNEPLILKDFLMFFPASLKSIAESMQLEIQKGDFPHLFNVPEHDSYVGSIPPLHSEHDYYCLHSKKEKKEIEELEKWYEKECETYCTCNVTWTPPYPARCATCGKQGWNMKEQLVAYCWLDVDVLAQCIEKFRLAHLKFGMEDPTPEGKGWRPTAIEPFEQMTLAQLAMKFFMQGHVFTGMRHALSKPRFHGQFSKDAILWLEHRAFELDTEILHAGNSEKEFYDYAMEKYVDGYAPSLHRYFEYLGCFWHGCPRCYADSIAKNLSHPKKNETWKQVWEKTEKMMRKFEVKHPGQVEFMWECDFKREHEFSERNERLCELIQDRNFFFGGRTEVFSCFARSTETHSLQHLDVTSMYPYVCSKKRLPLGHPTRYFGTTIQVERLNPSHPDAYFGYIRCWVIPLPTCVLGLLPQVSDQGKLEFNCHPKHGVWFSEELYFAMRHGYQVTDIYEVFHFDEHNRSEEYMRGYMSFFLRQKQEADGWKKAGASSESPDREEQERIVERLYIENGDMGRMRAAQVQKNPVKRALAKLFLNCLWGKFAQDITVSERKIIYNYQDWMNDIMLNEEIDRSSIRYRFLHDQQTVMCYYDRHRSQVPVNRKSNIWLAAAVTAHARVILHQQMMQVGAENVLYCDTDSVLYLHPRTRSITEVTQRGLGNWANETDEGSELVEFYALAPKSYLKVEREGEVHIKCKGVRMTFFNQIQTTPAIVAKMIEEGVMYPKPDDERTKLFLDHLIICPNSNDSRVPYASVFSIIMKKRVKPVLSKRRVVPLPREGLTLQQLPRIFLAPFGPLEISAHEKYAHVYDS